MTKKFTITFSVDVTLTVDELWPDGDAPENPTVDAVRELIEDSGGIFKVIDDWNLSDRDDYHVDED
jgi:hypothetical protein